MNNNLSIITWNARGIRNKHTELFQFLINQNIDICLVTETWLKPDISINHQEYFIYRNDRSHARGGGVAILLRKNISHQPLPVIDTNLIENIGVKIFTDFGSINVHCCYFPGGIAGIDGIRKTLFATDLHKLTRGEKYILGGDFNCRHQSWGCTRANCWGNILYERQNLYNIDIIYPTESTYVPSSIYRQSSTLDLFLTNIVENTSSAVVINDLGSDHLPVKITVNGNFNSTEFQFQDFSRANWAAFKRYLNRNLILPVSNAVFTKEDIDLKLIHFINMLNDAINVSVPLKRRRCTRKPFPYFIKVLIRNRNRHRRNWLRYRLVIDYNEFKRLNSVIKEEVDRFRNSSWNSMLSSLEKGSPPFWKITKMLRKKSSNIPVLTSNGSRFITNLEKCEILANTFALNHSHSSTLGDRGTNEQVRDTISTFNSRGFTSNNEPSVSTSTIRAIISRLKTKKSPGIDGINNSCLKALPRKGFTFLTILVNSCLKLGYFPNHFKESKIIPIKKPNKASDNPSSYRPISLLSSISKVLEKVIKDKITNFMDTNNILPPQQFGFRKEHNTVHPLIRIRNLVKSNFNSHKSTGMVLLDVKAAFDSVWHEGLIYKCIRLNFPAELIRIIQCFLSNRTFRVHIGLKCSDLYPISAGCPQGSCLSPVLYNIYTSDIPQHDRCELSIFADDTAVLCSGKLSSEITTYLQSGINELVCYFKKWKITINSNKSQAIYFTQKRKPCFTPQCNIIVDGCAIQWDDNVKYLGVILDPKMKFKDHIPYIVNKCNILIRVLYPFINRNSFLNISNKKLILKSIFHAVIFYAAPVWVTSAKCHLGKLQVVQNKLLKLIYNLPRLYSTSRLHQLAELDLVVDRLSKLTLTFNTRCLYSEYTHIMELVSI